MMLLPVGEGQMATFPHTVSGYNEARPGKTYFPLLLFILLLSSGRMQGP